LSSFGSFGNRLFERRGFFFQFAQRFLVFPKLANRFLGAGPIQTQAEQYLDYFFIGHHLSALSNHPGQSH
jgi:hypothetical protein